MSKQPNMINETCLGRIRCVIHRAFPTWFLWLLSALVLTSVSILFWHSFNHFGFKSGEWVTVSEFGPHFNGGQDVLFFFGGTMGAVYSWVRIVLIFRAFVCQRTTDRKPER